LLIDRKLLLAFVPSNLVLIGTAKTPALLLIIGPGLNNTFGIRFAGNLFDVVDAASHSPAAIPVGHPAKVIRAKPAHRV
jgi:hypothetical protein